MNERRRALEQALDAARAAEVGAEEAVREGVPRLTAAQETWYSLAALRERVATTLSIARERMRKADDDPGELRAAEIRTSWTARRSGSPPRSSELSGQLAVKARRLQAATTHSGCEDAQRAEENRLAALIRAAADRREGLARLTGQVNSLRAVAKRPRRRSAG